MKKVSRLLAWIVCLLLFCGAVLAEEEAFVAENENSLLPMAEEADLNEEENGDALDEAPATGIDDTEDALPDDDEEADADGEHEFHEFNNGVCEICGYVCPHEDTVEHGGFVSTSYEDNGDNHIVIGTISSKIVECLNCDETLSYEPGEVVKTIDIHRYGVDGKCIACGHINTCKHEHTHEDRAYDEDADVRVVDVGSNEYHQVEYPAGTYEYWIVCEDCFQTLEKGVSVSSTPVKDMEEHLYDDDICLQCGHVNTCEHKNVEKVLSLMDVTEYFDTGDDTYHYVYVMDEGEAWISTYCLDCGARLEDIEEDVPVGKYPVEHVYNADGVCVECGHKRGNIIAPTAAPTTAPTAAPTAAPTTAPTAAPTTAPTEPATPENTAKPASGDTAAKTGDVPKTGEDTTVVLAVVILMAAAAIVLVSRRVIRNY